MIAVCIATYNQEAFIAQTIESVLMQKCDEPIRIYIGDDASKDGTSTICKQYAHKDQRISYIQREHNEGLVNNTLNLYKRIIEDGCEYIAMLDGDDYWIDTNKLQLQIDYLHLHPNVGLVHTAAYDDIDGKLVDLESKDKPIGDLSLIYNYSGPHHTNSTVIFRTNLLHPKELDAIKKQHFLALDYVLYGIFSQRTHFGYINKHTAAWRNHTSVSQQDSFNSFVRYKKYRIRAWHWLDRLFPGRFHYHWIKAITLYTWQVLYAIVHYSKVYLKTTYSTVK